jgi:hypothetical protein
MQVDDLMIGSQDPRGVDYVIDILNKEYTKANVYEGENIDFLGMIFNFYTNGSVSISMKAMVGDLVNDMGIKVDQVSTTPAAQHLFEVSDGEKHLEKHVKEWYHSKVAKALYYARPDMLTAVAFLSTRVQ